VREPVVGRTPWTMWLWPAMAAMLVVALLVMIHPAPRAPAKLVEVPVERFKPVLVQELYYGSRTGEVFIAADNHPRREVRRWYVNRYRWERASDKALIEVSVPREEIVNELVAMY